MRVIGERSPDRAERRKTGQLSRAPNTFPALCHGGVRHVRVEFRDPSQHVVAEIAQIVPQVPQPLRKYVHIGLGVHK
jgi:hypothetical protein